MTPRTGTLAIITSRLTLDRTDAELLGDFVRHRDEAAFAALVRRHGRAVFGVCRRILGNSTDADDAFQATFLVLAKKCHRLAFHDDISAWLFAVAMRASRELLRRRSRRRETSGPVPDVGTTHEFDTEISHVVLDEVAKLSASYRAAVVLCELDGVSRADAAKRLGIPEGTLSSRLSAARKQLAARLTARGLSLAVLVPFGVNVPTALAHRVMASETPSALVLNLLEVLMRTSVTSVTGKCVAAVAVLAVAVVGWSFGDDPKAQPIRPAAATVAVEDKPSSQLILTFREDVRFLTPTGKELQRIDYSAAKKADPELLTGTVTIGTGQFMKIERYLPSFGRAGPGGVVPLSSHGMKLMMPGTPPTIKLLDETVPGDLVIGWTADGKDFFTQGVEDASLVWGVTGYKTMKVDATTGQRESLPFGKEYLVFDVSADGKHFLAARFKERPLGLPGFTNEACDLCVLTAAGEAKTLAKSWASKFDMRTRISPDGTRTAAVMAAKDQPTRVGISTFPKKGEVATEIVDLPGVEAKVECTGVAWSPDGKQIVSSWRNESWKKEQTWYVAVCDANGKNMRQVTTFEMKNDEQLRALDWR